MEKITCVIDACSYIYMQIPTYPAPNASNKQTFEDLTLFDLFIKSDAAIIKITQAVIDEIKDVQKQKITKYNSEYAILLQKGKHSFKRKFLDNLHDGLFNKKLYLYDDAGAPIQNDFGEKANFAATLDLFFEGKRSLVFLSDDTKAQKNTDILSSLTQSFPMCLYWNTFDVIAFLYLIGSKKKKPILSESQVENTITDIFSYSIGKAKELADYQYNKAFEKINQTNYPSKNVKDREIEKAQKCKEKSYSSFLETFNIRKANELQKFETLKKIFYANA